MDGLEKLIGTTKTGDRKIRMIQDDSHIPDSSNRTHWNWNYEALGEQYRIAV